MEIPKAIIEEIERFKNQDDYTNREQLRCYMLRLPPYIRQFYEVGTEEYNTLFRYLDGGLKPIYDQACRDLKTFKIVVEYKSAKSRIFKWSTNSFEERNKEEVLQRLKERDWYNIDTDRKIKPIFVNIDITEIVGGR